jgi:hypothetical protein
VNDITLEDLKFMQDTLDAYEKLLDHARTNWKILTKKEQKAALLAFDKIVELAKDFEV